MSACMYVHVQSKYIDCLVHVYSTQGYLPIALGICLRVERCEKSAILYRIELSSSFEKGVCDYNHELSFLLMCTVVNQVLARQSPQSSF